MAETEDLYQIALLIDQLKHDDSALRASASQNIAKIARALGPERTREELIPFLGDCVDDEDEVIINIAEQLGDLCELVGGNENVHVLLAPLELLVCGEESAVRAKGIHSIEKVVSHMAVPQISNHFFPFLSQLANRDWFTARASAAAMAHLGYEQLPAKQQADVMSLFLKLTKDETPLVRRVAAQSLARMIRLAKSSQDSSLMAEMILTLKAIAVDEQDSIRIQVVPICTAITDVVSENAKKSDIIPAVLAIANDKSWRVRWSLAHKMHEIMDVLNGNGAAAAAAVVIKDPDMLSALCALFDGLLNDTEAEVRAAAASHLSTVSRFMEKDFIENTIIPTSQKLVTDSSEFVRAFFAAEVNNLAPALGRESSVQHVLPLLLSLLRDENSEVRLNVISSLDAINSVIGVDLLSQSLLPAITELSQDGKWRVRLAVIENIPMLGKQLGVQFFDDKLIEISMKWLSDTVYSIRKAAAENLRKLTDLFGEEWSKRQIVPKIRELHDAATFSQRLTALYAVQVLTQSLSVQTVHRTLLPLVLNMANDPVANVRFNVAITLQKASTAHGQPQDGDLVIPKEVATVLSKLSNDLDRDVRFYAGKAIASMKATEGA